MIGWLQGELADPWRLDKRYGLQLRCHGVGYDVQVSHRQWLQLPAVGTPTALHIHASIREDASTLYGFSDRHERDLFRELVAVSGVGPQMALGLLGAMAPSELIQAIVHADLRRLTQAPGVGKRTAERLAVELRSRLQETAMGMAALPSTWTEQAATRCISPWGPWAMRPWKSSGPCARSLAWAWLRVPVPVPVAVPAPMPVQRIGSANACVGYRATGPEPPGR